MSMSQRQATVNNLNGHNRSPQAAQALQVQQSTTQGQVQNPPAHQQISLAAWQIFLTQPNVAQAYHLKLAHSNQQQNIQVNGRLSTEGHALQPTQNGRIPSGTNGQDVMVSSSTSSSPWSSCQFVNNVNNGQISRRNMTVTSPTTSPMVASLPLYSNNSTSSPPVSTGLNRLPLPPYPYGTPSQSAPSQNMSVFPSGSRGLPPSAIRANGLPPPYHILDSSSSAHTDQNSPPALDNSNRNGDRAPNLSNGTLVNSTPIQQQNSPVVVSDQHRLSQLASQREADLYYNHGPNVPDRPALISIDKRSLLLKYLLRKKKTDIDQVCFGDLLTTLRTDKVQGYPKKSVQVHRAVAVVPPISQQLCRKSSCDEVPFTIEKVWSLTDEKQTEEASALLLDSDCSSIRKSSSSGKGSEDGGCPKDGVTAGQGSHPESAVCSNTNSLNNLITEKEDAPKDQNHGDLGRSDCFFGMSAVTWSLGKVRKLVAALELLEQKPHRNDQNGQDFARTILDLYWDGSYHNYIVTELGGTFGNILKEAAEFDTEEDKIVFDAMQVNDLDQLNSKCHILTSCFDGGIATEVDKSSWRNVSDESLNICKELTDEDFIRKNMGSLLENSNDKAQETDLFNNIEAPCTTSFRENSVSKEDLQASSDQAEQTDHIIPQSQDDLEDLHAFSDQAEQTGHIKPQSQDDLGQNSTMPISTTSNRLENKEVDLSLPVQVSFINPSRLSDQNQAPADLQKDTAYQTAEVYDGHDPKQCFRIALDGSDEYIRTSSKDSHHQKNSHHISQDLDHKECLPKEGCELSESICEQAETSDEGCPKNQDDAMLSIKLNVLSSENEIKTFNSNYVDQDLVSSPQEDPPSPTLFIDTQSDEFDQDSPMSPDEPMLSMKITVLSLDELKAFSKEFCEDSDDSVYSVAASSPICLDSSDHSEGDLSEMLNQEEINILSGEEEIPSFLSMEDVFKFSEIQTSRMKKKQNDHLTKSTGKEQTNPLKNCRKEKETSMSTKKHQHPKRIHRPSTHYAQKHSSNVSRKGSAQTAHKKTKPSGLEFHIPTSSPSGTKASSPISPSAAIRKKKSDVMKELDSLRTGEGEKVEKPSASHVKGSGSPTSTFRPLAQKKRSRESLEECGNLDELTEVLVPSGQSCLNVTNKSSISQDTGAEVTKAPDNKRHRHEAVNPTATSGANYLNLTGTTENPEIPKPMKRKCAVLKPYGSSPYYTVCERDLPARLTVLYSPEKNSAKNKIMNSWKNSFVPTPVKSRRLSEHAPEDENREKDVPERTLKHQNSPSKDKEEQQRSSVKGHQTKYKKRTNRSSSLGEMKREALRMGRLKMSPREQKDMGLHIIKQFRRNHVKL